ncbi:uncharacterized protein MELLADRAFT_94755 [Melampsora larici-populina 98AG31]|uniref:Uncharacterized protein n=1 Tax=Melampsora larici-populina (strain 98AG31 / pathotype 3-4-7) TaxID=747676 RepID=F4RP93_MELLP|nr:uncharacterized protein MELLADRAFT_87664 [Melampsora larici-populina 98AG31]XP_007417446.1 uncharacterized protein MELLADRAFT_94755 [Melampsora larici-populina 98AG31]EGF99268.1 hypothetical protein MELLADRAFT_94755 [Melampsora larici-populina 98AG31]EGG05777.1 hypothetical protein MELLADRAFT_87664 [Melampsora larici-populina 98AG31]
MMIIQGSKTSKKSLISLLIISLFRWLLNYSSIAWSNETWRIGSDRIDWDHQIIHVTGGSDGLGRVITETLAIKNMRFFWDIRPLTANPSDSDVHHYECDISDAKAVEAVADRVKNEVGDPTIIINNVEVANGTFIIDLNPSEIQRFGVNIMAHFHLLKAFLPTLIELKNGYIVSTISIALLASVKLQITVLQKQLF